MIHNVPLNKEKSDEEQYRAFSDLMQHFFERNPDKKLQDFDLVNSEL